MLYDQAQLVLAYLDAAQTTGDVFNSVIAEDTLDYVLSDLTSPQGGFFSAEDADSLPHHDSTEKREGAFYVWLAKDIDGLFGADAEIVRRRFGIEDGGNVASDPQGEFRGTNIPYIAQDIDDIAARTGRSVDDVMRVIGGVRQTLYDARAARPRPHLDDKVITAWNGLMIAAFARAARVLVDSPNRARWRGAAEGAATFIKDHLWNGGARRLLRRYRDGEAAIDGFCEDYAYLIWGLLELFQATGDQQWLTWAAELQARQTELFFDEADGGWFSTTGADPTVLLRLKEDYDGAEPSAASVTTMNLMTLAHITGDESYRARAARALERYGPQIGKVARVMPFMMSNLVKWHGTPMEITITGKRDDERTIALERAVAKKFLPFAVFLYASGEPSAQVCSNRVCQMPTSDPDELLRQIEVGSTPSRIILG
jgi:uncharacterized protein YyaL (SSP411 family)